MPTLEEDDAMPSRLDCHGFPLELMRKLTDDDDDDDDDEEAYRGWPAGHPADEDEENELEKAEDELPPSDLCLGA